MKMLLPRWDWVLPVFVVGIPTFWLYDSWSDFSTRAACMTVALPIGGFGLYLLYRCVALDASLWICGERLRKKVVLPSGSSFCVAGLTGLADKTLIVRLKCTLPQELKPKMQSFRLVSARSNVVVPQAHFAVRLLGRNNDNEEYAQVTQGKLEQWLERFGDSMRGEDEDDHTTLELVVTETYAHYLLQVDVEAGLLNGKEKQLKSTPSIPLQIGVQLAAGLKVKDARRFRECSIRYGWIELAQPRDNVS